MSRRALAPVIAVGTAANALRLIPKLNWHRALESNGNPNTPRIGFESKILKETQL